MPPEQGSPAHPASMPGNPPPRSPARPTGRTARLRSLERVFAEAPATVRVFAYGSLMWDPCFEVDDSAPAALDGHRRIFSIWSVHARGTPERPGLGLALEPCSGARCEGLLFTLPAGTGRAALGPLWEREMWTTTYRPAWVSVAARDMCFKALTFIAERTHPQYAGHLPVEDAARRIATARGTFGECRDYLAKTVATLRSHGMVDSAMDELLAAVDRWRAT